MNSTELERVNAIHRAMLEQWRVAMDLVGPGPIEPHFQDAAGVVEGLNARGRWADLGSGAGFPGIALAAAFPEAEVLLVESRQKRAIFLENVVATAGLRNARVLRVRAETLPPDLDGVISRAFMPPDAFVALAGNLLRPDGVVVLMLGDRESFEFEGWVTRETSRYRVGDGWRRRQVLSRARPTLE